MSAVLIRQALSTKACPFCHRKLLLSGMVFARRARCLGCDARPTIRLGFRRGEPQIEFGTVRAPRQYGARRA